MSDLIERQAAQTELMMKCERYTLARESHGMGYVEWSSDLISVADAMDAIRDLPSAQPETEERTAESVQNVSDSDLISRKAAIDALDCINGVEEVLRSLPSAQQWIPCSERLPKKSGQYYVSGGGKAWVCEYLIIPNFTIGGWCNNASNPVVQAWLPFPEPYKGR